MPIVFQEKRKELLGSFFVPALTQEECDWLSTLGFFGNATRVDTRTRWYRETECYHRMTLYRPREAAVGGALGLRLLEKADKGQQCYKLVLVPVPEKDFSEAEQGNLSDALAWVESRCGGWSWT